MMHACTRRATLIVIALGCALAAPGSASADEAVQIDPDSPAGVEYKLPLDQARRDATPGSGGGGSPDGGGSGAAPAPLFGAGISPGRSEKANGAPRSDRGGRSRRSKENGDASAAAGEGGPGGPGSDGAPTGRYAADFTTAAGDGATSGGFALGVVVLAVLLVGGVLGLLLRRSLGTTTTS